MNEAIKFDGVFDEISYVNLKNQAIIFLRGVKGIFYYYNQISI